MSKQTSILKPPCNFKDLEPVLECMEDKEFDVRRKQNYAEIVNTFNDPDTLDTKMAERILAICVDDLRNELQYTYNAVLVIQHILKKVQEGKCTPEPDLLPSALAMLDVGKMLKNQPVLRGMIIETMTAYPSKILCTIATTHSNELIEFIEFNYSVQATADDHKLYKFQAIKLLTRILKILPPEKKLEFTRNGLNVWFKVIIPTIIAMAFEEKDPLKQNLAGLELLVDAIIPHDYENNPFWQTVYNNICNPKIYPSVLKSFVEIGNDDWQRLWIVFIKLLKDQITKTNGGASPINALLPVLEMAFKLDTNCRCRAFECWNALTDNFSAENNEFLVNKRLKLLMIPLKLNNAKVPATVHTKFNTWWHLIRKFHSKIDKFTDTVLIPFVHFCFGKYSGSLKVSNSSAPGQMSAEVAKQCAEALIEIIGHYNCDGCVSLPRLNSKLINTKMLAEHWSDWMVALCGAIKTLANGENGQSKTQQLTCLWKSFVGTIGELPENQIRADLFNELLTVAKDLVKQCKVGSNNPDEIVNVLLISLFDDDPKIKPLLKTKTATGPIYTILEILQSSDLKYFYSRVNPEALMCKLKRVTDVITDEALVKPEKIIAWLMQKDSTSDGQLMIWAALAESVCESSHNLSHDKLCSMLIWPLKTVNNLPMAKSELASSNWYTLYSYVRPMMTDGSLDSKIAAILMGKCDVTLTNSHFMFATALALLKQKLLNDKNAECEWEAEILLSVMSNAKEFTMDKSLPILIDTLVMLLNKLVVNVNLTLAEYCAGIVKIVFRVIHVSMLIKKENIPELTQVENIFTLIFALFEKEEYGPLKPSLADALVGSLPLIQNRTPVRYRIQTVLKTFLAQIKDSDKQLFENIQSAIDGEANSAKGNNQGQNKSSFTAPPPKSAKKSKKKEPNIVNTVVEDGEEFVVVKSNWKFNPKKLTENQKEKLKRKREDIPALYQDLSQSQDEFKLTSWKTDSQDASTTTSSKSNSKTNEDFTDILKNIPSTDIVPKIMENIVSENKDAEKEKPTEKSVPTVASNNGLLIVQQPSPTVKDPKTPRLALKDRVFRNVRNLIEKSGVPTDAKIPQQITEDLNQTVNENNLKTPVSKATTNVNVTNSAPPKIASERPTRSIKKPKKFEDAELFALKKKRRVKSGSVDSDTSDKSEGTVQEQEVTKHKLEPNKEVQKEDVAKDSEKLQKNKQETKLIEPLPPISTETKEDKEKNPPVEPVDDSHAPQNIEVSNIKSAIVQKEDDKIKPQKDKVAESTKNNEERNEITENLSQVIEEISTPKPVPKKKDSDDHSTIKKKRSRIEKQLLIDMVEGHPVLQSQSDKRVTRKNLPNDNDNVSKRRKSLIEKSNKIKAELGVVGDNNDNKKVKGKDRSPKSVQQESQSITVEDSQDKILESSEEPPMSEDVIESSQDSTITTISVKSSTKKKIPIVRLDKGNPLAKKATDTQKLLDDFDNEIISLSDLSNQESKDDIELPKNKTMVEENTAADLTENMDTEPVDSSGDVILVTDEQSPIVINTESSAPVGKETQEMAEADTLPMDVDSESIPFTVDEETTKTVAKETNVDDKSQTDNDITNVTTQEDITPALPATAEVLNDIIAESSNTGSPLKDDVQRKKEFLNDTIEISPIKSMSPIRDAKKSPSPETSTDYVVIKLTSPVQSNGEPFNEKCDSPEIFTEDKVSPDKRDQSPPRKEVVTTNSSPSSSLSLKKNRPQMRPNGRAAQMLELCAPETLQTLISTDRSDNEEIKKGSPMNNSSARRNLRILYNSVGDNPVNDVPPVEIENNEESESFLKFKRALPTPDCSPAGPILKRKLADIADETTASPASKRKRVSFHDPPVSTTVAVQKYIEPLGVRSPQSSTLKRQDWKRSHTGMKSPKRLDKVFRLETVLTKAVESFSDEPTMSNDTEMSLDETPAVQIVKASELNDTDPICPELLDCKDPIDNIAGELSSYSTKTLLIKELQGKVDTVADLAKMTELEVNRLCIKAPKVKVAKKVLTDYASKRAVKVQEKTEEVIVLDTEMVNTEAQTDEVLTKSLKTQTVPVPVTFQHTQTDVVSTSHSSAQTNETGHKSTKDVIETCLVERPDFVDQLTSQLQPTAIRRISETLPFDESLSLLLKKMDFTNTTEVLNQVVAQCLKDDSGNMNLSILQEYLCKRFASKDLILFCSQLLQKIHDKPS